MSLGPVSATAGMKMSWLGAGVCLVLALAATVPYGWVLDLPLTAIATVPTIAAAEIDSLAELPAVLFRELRGDPKGSMPYYRPITLLTYAVDWLFWGWTPFGYHLTDLLLHALAAASVLWMVRTAFGLGLGVSAAIAGLFLLHPATIEVVPAVARRQEPLLVIAFSMTLVGAHWLPLRRGWLFTLMGTLLAVTSVERGLVVPALVFLYVMVFRPSAPRLRRAVLWSLPSLAIATTFFLTRGLMFGRTGIEFNLPHLIRIPAEFLLQLVYPQQVIDLRMPRTPFAVAVALIGVVLVGVSTAWLLWRSRERKILVFSGLAVGAYCTLFAVAGQFHSWYVYTVTPLLGLSLVVLVVEGIDLLGEHQRLRGALQVAGCAAIAVPLVITSPCFRDYSGWRVAGSLGSNFTRALEATMRDLPPETQPVVINLPAHYRESASELLVTRSAAIFWPGSIRSWCQLNAVRDDIVFLGASDLIGSVDPPTVDRTEDSIRVYFPDGDSTYTDPSNAFGSRWIRSPGRGREFAWPLTDDSRPSVLLLFDGERLRRIDPEDTVATSGGPGRPEAGRGVPG